MDPITQGMLGATAGQSASRKTNLKTATIVGILGGMAPDLDVLIRSSTDPLLALEYHRQFTHSLFFIPFGAASVAVFAYALFARQSLSWQHTYLFSLAGYATHALLDACTTYGTLLLWPISDMRFAWNTISVVDPVFTLPALALVISAYITRNKSYTLLAATWMALYLGLGLVQNQRATNVALELAKSRGHQPLNLGLKPSFANIIVWKSVYEHGGKYYVDAVRVLGGHSVLTGSSTDKLALDKHFPWLDGDSQQAKDVERFRWFSNNHLGLDPENPNRIIDIRYSLLPNQMTGMWGVELSPTAGISEHAAYTTNRPKGAELSSNVRQLWSMITGDAVASNRQ